MTQQARKSDFASGASGEVVEYSSGLDHLADEISVLDLRIRQEITSSPKRQHATSEADLLGLVLTEVSMLDLVTNSPNPLATTALKKAPHSSIPANVLPELESRRQFLTSQITYRRAAAARAGLQLPLSHLAQLFTLSTFDEFCIIVALSSELDRKYERLYAYIQDDVTRKKPSVQVALDLFLSTPREKLDARRSFDAGAPLISNRIVELVNDGSDYSPLVSRYIVLDEGIRNFLLGANKIDPRLASFVQVIGRETNSKGPAISGSVVGRLVDFISLHQKDPLRSEQVLFLSLHGPEDAAKRQISIDSCLGSDLPILICDAAKMLSQASPVDEIVLYLRREALLRGAAICVEHLDALLADDEKGKSQFDAFIDAISIPGRPVFLLADQRWSPRGKMRGSPFVEIPFDIPRGEAAVAAWDSEIAAATKKLSAPLALDQSGPAPTKKLTASSINRNVDPRELGAKFKFTTVQIYYVVSSAVNQARWRDPSRPQLMLTDLEDAARTLFSPKLGALVTRIVPERVWDDLILPDDAKGQLKDIITQVRWWGRVFSDWGYDKKLSRGKGLAALFSGPPGTGKTLAAEIIAGVLNLEMLRIDLSQVVSKYIGETEKNFRQVFQEARASRALLFFDECDTVFTRRSEVNDAHDRYANLETGYLLQQMEEYEGVAILATNLRQNIDDAFVRRLQYIVEFTFPDPVQRGDILRVSFPDIKLLAADVNLDALARDLDLAGGNLKNIALAAAFYAAEELGPNPTTDSEDVSIPDETEAKTAQTSAHGSKDTPTIPPGVIHERHLFRAAHREYQKLGKQWPEARDAESASKMKPALGLNLSNFRQARAM